jgi:hypothetical protein
MGAWDEAKAGGVGVPSVIPKMLQKRKPRGCAEVILTLSYQFDYDSQPRGIRINLSERSPDLLSCR